MTYFEIENKIQELYRERDILFDTYAAVHDKYNDMANEEYPFVDYVEKDRIISKELRKYEIMLESALDKPINEKRRKSEFIKYILNDDNKQKRLEERAKRTCPKYMSTVDNKPNTENKAKELQERLVQCCIDYILETGDRDISRVDFSADSLQESANFGKWIASTDSFITTSSLLWDDEIKEAILEKTGEYC